jgi:hypothetical protein
MSTQPRARPPRSGEISARWARVEKVLSFGHSATYLGLLVMLVVGLAALVFRRRDVN